MVRYTVVAAALVATLLAPFILRPREKIFSGKPDGEVVVITPHQSAILQEFSRAFAAHMRKEGKGNIAIDWRVPGGTSEITRVLDADFEASFQNYWKNDLDRTWSREIAQSFDNRKIDVGGDPSSHTTGHHARIAFLGSDVGIGVDVFFGGGSYDFQRHAAQGHLVARDTRTTRFGPAAIAEAHPDWFGPEVIPPEVGGEPYYDPELRWVGSCLSSFGIVYNTDSLRRLGIAKAPAQWDDLGSPLLAGEIALADPTKSGSAAKAFEMLLQQKIQAALANAQPVPGVSDREVYERALETGWAEGLNLIQHIAANARYFTDDATKVPRDVAAGVSTAGMCIDFYGRTQSEAVRKPDGTSRVGYITPVGGSSRSVDPIALLRGAPHPKLAHDFIEFVLSREGQRLWNFRPGTPDGPTMTALRRLPVRRDSYTPANLEFFSDPDALPYDHAGDFVYRPELTAKAFNSIRLIVRVMCLDTHDELRAAWETLIRMEFPPRATRMFHDIDLVNYRSSTGRISDVLASSDRLLEVKTARDLSDQFRLHYRRTVEMARRGE